MLHRAGDNTIPVEGDSCFTPNNLSAFIVNISVVANSASARSCRTGRSGCTRRSGRPLRPSRSRWTSRARWTSRTRITLGTWSACWTRRPGCAGGSRVSLWSLGTSRSLRSLHALRASVTLCTLKPHWPLRSLRSLRALRPLWSSRPLQSERGNIDFEFWVVAGEERLLAVKRHRQFAIRTWHQHQTIVRCATQPRGHSGSHVNQQIAAARGASDTYAASDERAVSRGGVEGQRLFVPGTIHQEDIEITRGGHAADE